MLVSLMIRPVLRHLDHRDAVERVRAWTRARFGLPAAAMILVNERVVDLPGFPPVETAIAFWDLDETRYHFKLFKPVSEIAEDDLPFAWLKPALAVSPEFVCDCC